jgi:hypothetical protein
LLRGTGFCRNSKLETRNAFSSRYNFPPCHSKTTPTSFGAIS